MIYLIEKDGVIMAAETSEPDALAMAVELAACGTATVLRLWDGGLVADARVIFSVSDSAEILASARRILEACASSVRACGKLPERIEELGAAGWAERGIYLDFLAGDVVVGYRNAAGVGCELLRANPWTARHA